MSEEKARARKRERLSDRFRNAAASNSTEATRALATAQGKYQRSTLQDMLPLGSLIKKQLAQQQAVRDA
jgi:hypothetical protein